MTIAFGKRPRILFIGIFVWVLVGQAADRYVATSGTDSGACTNWDIAAGSIQFAVDLATNANDTVWVSNGTYLVTNQIVVTNQITVKGLNGWTNTLVAADWPAYTTRCFYVTSTGTLDGLTISNGHCYGSNNYFGGAGAYVSNDVTIQNCYFVDNVLSNSGVYAGGGGVMATCSAIISNCWFVHNQAYKVDGGASVHGGAIFVYNVPARGGTIVDCNIISNSAIGASTYGGGVDEYYSYSAPYKAVYVTNCLIAGNTADSSGGGVNSFYGLYVNNSVISNNAAANGGGWYGYSLYLRNSTVVDNRATNGHGGGAYCADQGIFVSNCVIAGNTASGIGGGMYLKSLANPAYSRTVAYCIIRNNTCGGSYGGGLLLSNPMFVHDTLICNNTNTFVTGYGGGVYMTNSVALIDESYGLVNCTIADNYSANAGGGVLAGGTNAFVINCVIANNRAGNSDPDVIMAGNSNNYFYSCVTNVVFTPNQGNITSDPLFVDASAGNWRLQANSPCINAGTNQSWMTGAFDLDGRTRIRYGTADMGAYEMIYNGAVYILR